MTPTEQDPERMARQATVDFHAIADAAKEALEFSRRQELYRLLHDQDGPTVAHLADVPAGDFTVAGWRFAAVLAEAEADSEPDATVAPLLELAAEFRRRALEAGGQDRNLDPGSFGYLDAIYPRRVKPSAGQVVIECGIPFRRDGNPCTFRAGRAAEAASQAHDAYVAHVIHDHSSTAARPGAQPGDAY